MLFLPNSSTSSTSHHNTLLLFWWTSQSLPSDLISHIAALFFWPDWFKHGAEVSFHFRVSGRTPSYLFPWLQTHTEPQVRVLWLPIFMELLYCEIKLGPLPRWGPRIGVTIVPWYPRQDSGEKCGEGDADLAFMWCYSTRPTIAF